MIGRSAKAALGRGDGNRHFTALKSHQLATKPLSCGHIHDSGMARKAQLLVNFDKTGAVDHQRMVPGHVQEFDPSDMPHPIWAAQWLTRRGGSSDILRSAAK